MKRVTRRNCANLTASLSIIKAERERERKGWYFEYPPRDESALWRWLDPSKRILAASGTGFDLTQNVSCIPPALNPCIQMRYPLRMIFVEWRKGFVALCVRNYVATVNLPVGLAACQLFRYQRDKSTLYAGTIVNWPGYRPTRSARAASSQVSRSIPLSRLTYIDKELRENVSTRGNGKHVRFFELTFRWMEKDWTSYIYFEYPVNNAWNSYKRISRVHHVHTRSSRFQKLFYKSHSETIVPTPQNAQCWKKKEKEKRIDSNLQYSCFHVKQSTQRKIDSHYRPS